MAPERPQLQIPARARVLLIAACCALTGLLVYRLNLDQHTPGIHSFSGETMGTTFLVKVVSRPLADERRAVVSHSISTCLDEVDRLMSTWRPESEVSRFNQYHGTGPFTVSDETLQVLAIAREVSVKSQGAFDVTVAPLVAAHGFGRQKADSSVSSDEELAMLLTRVGYERVQLDPESRTVTKSDPELGLDLSAVAKGFAVDQVAHTLVELGFTAFLVEVGGELRATGRRPDGSAWRVAIEAPDPERRVAIEVVELHDEAMATSGDYRNFVERDGKRISHLIDPHSGIPLPQTGQSVTVLHESAALADAWATALFVLGREKGLAIATHEELAVLWIRAENDDHERLATTAFRDRWRVAPSRR